jgi:cytochrome P450
MDGQLDKRVCRESLSRPRQCIGNTFALMETTLVLATVAQRYRFRLVEGHPVVPLAPITLRPRHGIRAVLEAR